MIILLSPAKTLDFKSDFCAQINTMPRQIEQSLQLFEIIRQYQPQQLSQIQDLSEKLALLNFERWQSFDWPYPSNQSKVALLAFKGDVYQGLDANSLDDTGLQFAQDHLRILSGFYGLLRPMDHILPYRLEMGTPIPNPRGKDLYHFWGDRITQLLNSDAQQDNLIVNLASQEYFAAVQVAKLNRPMLNIHFKENKSGQYKIIGIMAKRARGRMSRFIIDNHIVNPQDLKGFDWDGYRFRSDLSEDQNWVFVR